jgi:beta-galactosidase
MLTLNGKQIGETKPLDDESGIIYWDVPYQPGKLEVIGLNNKNEVCRYAIQTTQRPTALTAHVVEKNISTNNGVAHVIVQVTDANGLPVILSDDEITCTIKGPARLLGLEASNNSDMSSYTDNVHRAYHGRLLAYIKSTGETGKITINFTAPWLKGTSIEIEAVK